MFLPKQRSMGRLWQLVRDMAAFVAAGRANVGVRLDGLFLMGWVSYRLNFMRVMMSAASSLAVTSNRW